MSSDACYNINVAINEQSAIGHIVTCDEAWIVNYNLEFMHNGQIQISNQNRELKLLYMWKISLYLHSGIQRVSPIIVYNRYYKPETLYGTAYINERRDLNF